MTVKASVRIAKAKPPVMAAAPRKRACDPGKALAKTAKPKKARVRIFVSYCHANALQCAKLRVHLAQLERDEVEAWYDGEMEAGDRLSTEISRKLRAADVFVALMSPEYIASHWCQLEYKRAMGRRAKGSMRVVVVVVRPCAWKDTGAAELKVLPRDGRSVSDWRSMDHAFADVAEGIKGAVRTVRASPSRTVSVRPAKPARATAAPKPKNPAGSLKTTPGSRSKAAPVTKSGRQARNRAAK